jgi:hypothetical protein
VGYPILPIHSTKNKFMKTESWPIGKSVRIAGRENIVWEIPLPGRFPVFMSFMTTDVYQPIFIRASVLLDLWKREVANHGQGLAFGNPTTWRADRKFECAERGFAAGESNPVPIPTLHLEKVREIVSAGVEGQTRTIWLLANKCALIGMQCKPQDVQIFRQVSHHTPL